MTSFLLFFCCFFLLPSDYYICSVTCYMKIPHISMRSFINLKLIAIYSSCYFRSEPGFFSSSFNISFTSFSLHYSNNLSISSPHSPFSTQEIYLYAPLPLSPTSLKLFASCFISSDSEYAFDTASWIKQHRNLLTSNNK